MENVTKQFTDSIKREQVIAKIQTPLDPSETILIIGGGIHGAQAARIAKMHGWKNVILLERGDFSSETSRASTKLAHGGARYLLYREFSQVIHALRERQRLFKHASNSVKPIELLFPQEKREAESSVAAWIRIKYYAIGLWLYDALQNDPDLRTVFIKREDIDPATYPAIDAKDKNLLGCFRLYDGQFSDDARFVSLCILDARRKGANCLNYAQVNTLKSDQSTTTVNWTDTIENKSHSLKVGAVLNCAGPWAPEFLTSGHRVTENKDITDYNQDVAYSRGVHLMFQGKIQDASMMLKMPGTKDRTFFVLNIPGTDPATTMVGTTEKESEYPESNPQPTQIEIREILHYMSSMPALAKLGKPFYATAGLRTLRIDKKRSRKGTQALSRDHEWLIHENVATLLGGKYTDALNTVEQGLQKLSLSIGRPSKISAQQNLFSNSKFLKNWLAFFYGVWSGVTNFLFISIHHTLNKTDQESIYGDYPGEESTKSGAKKIQLFKERAQKFSISTDIIDRLISQFGSRVSEFSDEMLQSCVQYGATKITNLEVLFFLATEQVESINDLIRNRLSLHYHPELGLTILDDLVKVISSYSPSKAQLYREQADKYKKEVQAIKESIKKAFL